MPTYDYVCDGCTHAFEHFQSMSSNVLRTCPRCKKRKLRRLIGSGAGVIFKGGGFYETDYKRKGRKASEKKDAAAGSDPGGGGEPAGSGDSGTKAGDAAPADAAHASSAASKGPKKAKQPSRAGGGAEGGG